MAALSDDPAGCTEEEEEGEEKLCRYCFDGEEEGPLISPCNCKVWGLWVARELLTDH